MQPRNKEVTMIGVEFKLNINGVTEETGDHGNVDNVAFKICSLRKLVKANLLKANNERNCDKKG